MKIERIRESGPKAKVFGGRRYVWTQRWLNVPREMRGEALAVVLSLDEMHGILYDDGARERMRQEYNNQLDQLAGSD
ncbi:MAG: hypothetical protein JRD89_21400 [Deltaproteobacteria bacterium]|nr:hypothetical protein [Deltaproteobacteria bacterium]